MREVLEFRWKGVKGRCCLRENKCDAWSRWDSRRSLEIEKIMLARGCLDTVHDLVDKSTQLQLHSQIRKAM